MEENILRTTESSEDVVEVYKDIIDDAFKGESLEARQTKAARFLSKMQSLLSYKEFRELEKYTFKKLKA